MALKSTIYKLKISVSDLTRGHYKDYNLTTAKHPSETDERLTSRIIAFALHSHEDLVFAKGLSDDKEPDLWQKSLDGRILKWIEIGQPDEKRLRRMLEREHFDMTQQESLPDAYDQLMSVKREMAKLKNKVSTLEKQVQIMFGEHKRKELEALHDEEA